MIQGVDVYVNTALLAEEIQVNRRNQRKASVSDEQMLDIAEVCFARIAEILTRNGVGVREIF
jgi:hypothetical protein